MKSVDNKLFNVKKIKLKYKLDALSSLIRPYFPIGLNLQILFVRHGGEIPAYDGKGGLLTLY